MLCLKHTAVDTRLVHKEYVDDVLVSNFRAELPAHIPAEWLDSANLSATQRALLANHYGRHAQRGRTEGGQDKMLWRRSVPAVLPAAVADDPRLAFLCDYYETTGGQLLLKSNYLREEHEVALMNRFVAEENRIDEHERHLLSDALDRIGCQDRRTRYYMSMINDLQNYFFYRKHHEHVPGLMLIEVARQAIYAQYYRTSDHKRGEVTLTIRNLESDFTNFADANYPVSVCVETTTNEDEFKKTGIERREATFWQNGKRVSTIRIAGKAIALKLFKRLRVVRPADNHWFIPVKAFARTALFFDGSGKRSEADLEKVSRSAMMVRFARRPENTEPMRFVLGVDSIGYIDGKASFDALQEDHNAWVCRLALSELSADGERKWLEAIRNFSHLESHAKPW